MTGPWDTSAPLERYLDRAAQAGIHRTVLFSVFHSNYAIANRQVASIVKSRPGQFYGFAFIHPIRDSGRVNELIEIAVGKYGFCGIKVHRHDGQITREICEVAAAFSLPVLYDVMGDVSIVELLASEYPGVNFIIPHLGSFADDWQAQKSFIDKVSKHRNIYADTSGVRRFDLLVEAIRRAGTEKILFGSDGPWLHPGIELFKIRSLGLSDSDERLIMGLNFLRLISQVRMRPRKFTYPAIFAAEWERVFSSVGYGG
jgi:uncharacterized protein